MYLHKENRELFRDAILLTSQRLEVSEVIVEKDYYVTMVLKSLAGKVEDMVFKGGTSLTKCYQLLERFSEDIDISYTAESGTPGEARKKQLKKAVVATMEEFQFPITNLEKTRAFSNYNTND